MNLFHFERKYNQFGENSYGDTPGHISNPEVKTVNAESTWGAAPWEDRNLPNFFNKNSLNYQAVFLYFLK